MVVASCIRRWRSAFSSPFHCLNALRPWRIALALATSPFKENKVIIESSQIEYVCLLDDINGMVLNMKLTADGTDKFADYTKNNIGSAVRFVINGKTVSNPYINVEITDGNMNFTGDYTDEEYKAIFSEIKNK